MYNTLTKNHMVGKKINTKNSTEIRYLFFFTLIIRVPIEFPQIIGYCHCSLEYHLDLMVRTCCRRYHIFESQNMEKLSWYGNNTTRDLKMNAQSKTTWNQKNSGWGIENSFQITGTVAILLSQSPQSRHYKHVCLRANDAPTNNRK